VTAPLEVPQADQLATANTALNTALDLHAQARTAMYAARDAYTAARDADPASQDTDQARHAWAEARHDLVDALTEVERARDELTAIERQARP
jgi:hypothetical protein